MLYGTNRAAAGAAVVPIGGVTPFSTLDCPGRISAVFYFQGCPFRCPYCHNAEFQPVNPPAYPMSDFTDFLRERKGFLETIVFSGGEPLLFPEALDELTGLVLHNGFEAALHTSGFRPGVLKNYAADFPLKWVGIDLKAAPEDYPAATGIEGNYFEKTAESIRILKDAGIPFEVRTTIFPALLEREKLESLVESARNLGINQTVWQVYSLGGRPDPRVKAGIIEFIRDGKLEPFIQVR
ncbi:MAG: anaerobic ribonucleoside-triphosphate reductase activating protein [Acidobacteria bacterium]|nr:anaerobic ribonucleoside-triphosphate reductase activating protein [Acidobacteriota bacterium]